MDTFQLLNDTLSTLLNNFNSINYIDLSIFSKEEEQVLFEKINKLIKYIVELNEFTFALANGDLNAQTPDRRNYFASGLKELHANLMHLAWKVDQISKGDYNQKIDYMGQLSDSFNHMADTLKMRDKQLQEYRDVLEVVLAYSNIMVFVLSAESSNLLYGSIKGEKIKDAHETSEAAVEILSHLRKHPLQENQSTLDWDFYCNAHIKWYSVKTMQAVWVNNENAYFHILFDMSQTKALEEELQNALFRDVKTGTYNHAYAIKTILQYLKNNTLFSICFIDLDNLKKINDLLGHSYGDDLIMYFVEIASLSIRGADILCRVGGDEFLVLLPKASTVQAEQIVNRIRFLGDNMKENKQKPYDLRFSYGIETFSDIKDYELNTQIDQTEDKYKEIAQLLIDKADQKMYEQKRVKKEKR